MIAPNDALLEKLKSHMPSRNSGENLFCHGRGSQPLQRRRRFPTATAPIMRSARDARLHHAFTGTGTGAAATAFTDVVTGDALFAEFGSLVLLPAVTAGVTAPALGAV